MHTYIYICTHIYISKHIHTHPGLYAARRKITGIPQVYIPIFIYGYMFMYTFSYMFIHV